MKGVCSGKWVQMNKSSGVYASGRADDGLVRMDFVGKEGKVAEMKMFSFNFAGGRG